LNFSKIRKERRKTELGWSNDCRALKFAISLFLFKIKNFPNIKALNFGGAYESLEK
jgi:hypothetical protein